MADDPFDHLLGGDIDSDLFPGGDPLATGDADVGVTENREEHFNRESGRFHDPMTGEFEDGSPPPDLDTAADRYRAKDGQFKESSADLFDEPEEVAQDSLEPRG